MKIGKKIKRKIKRSLGLEQKPIKRHYFSKKVKTAVLNFQRRKCAVDRCNNKRYLEFDHIRYRNDNSVTNCQALCPYHHRMKTRQDKIKKQIEMRINK